ncbi:MAG: PAS domain S-box protein [Acidobacteriaceae bacterium]
MLETELFAFLENSAEAAFALRRTGEICFWNHASAELFGYPAKEAFGKTCCALLHGLDSLGTEVCLNHATVMGDAGRRAGVPAFDLNVTTSDGKRTWISLSTLVYRNPRTGASLLVHLAHDISARKKREDLLTRMTELLREVSVKVDDPAIRPPVGILSTREVQLLRMFASGLTAPQVVEKLQITPQTLRNHLHHVNCKLRTHNRLEAVTHAIQRKLI